MTKTITASKTSTADFETELENLTINGYFYVVDLGKSTRPRHHHVGINGICTCSRGENCPAVEQVRQYLAKGGRQALRPPYGFYPVAPAVCPVCKDRVIVDQSLSSRHRGVGWRCASGGQNHYWQHRARISARGNKKKELA